MCINMYYIYRERQDNHEIEKTFLKRFDVSLLQLSFCVLIHIQNIFNILQVYYNKIVFT